MCVTDLTQRHITRGDSTTRVRLHKVEGGEGTGGDEFKLLLAAG
jgi:hypothetical protein